MGQRVGLHNELCGVLASFSEGLWGSYIIGENETAAEAVAKEARKHVYFQPPESLKMSYPCIVYELDRIVSTYANDKPYTHKRRYSVTVIDKNPDSKIPEKVAALKSCSHDRHFVADNLHHDVFTIYY